MKESIDDGFNFIARIDYGVKAGARAALIQHKRLGIPIHVWENGKVVEIPADQIEIPDEPLKKF